MARFHWYVGQEVTRWLAGTLPQKMIVLKIENGRIYCGSPEYPGADWEFDPDTGAEIDDDLGFGPPPKITGSYIVDKRREN